MGELDRQARAIAVLVSDRAKRGERVLLLYPAGMDFIAAFFGCLYAGLLPVPSYPPRAQARQARLSAIALNARPALVLGTAAIVARSQVLSQQIPELAQAAWLATGALPRGLEDGWRPLRISAEAPAFLQYTSGSTAEPRGVVVTHRNLLHNQEMIRAAFGQSSDSVIVGWLPLYHDMGLIGNVLQPLYSGGRSILMAPLTFLQEPRRWLEAISRYRASTSGGPNFAYDLCVRRIPEERKEGLDLSTWNVAFNGAEPVRAATLDRFAAAFAGCGMRRSAFYPCYGLAEATLFVSGGRAGAGAVVLPVANGALEENRAEPIADGQTGGSRSLVGCGRPWGGQRIVIVDPAKLEACAPSRVGEIWVAGESVAAGYWERAEETQALFEARLATGEGPFLRTGDLGFLVGDELFVTGRNKDLLILRGRNHYPQDLELTAEASHPALRPGCGAAFTVEGREGERLVLLQEANREVVDAKVTTEIADSIRRAVADEHEIAVDEVVLLRPGAILKTSSGKVRRGACRAAFLAGELATVARSSLADERRAAVSPADAVAMDWRAALSALSQSARHTVLRGLLQEQLARLLRSSPASFAGSRPLTGVGLDSLVAVELKGEVEERYGVSLSLTELLRGATLEDLCTEIAARLWGTDLIPADVDPTATLRRLDETRLSAGQKALWFVDRLSPAASAYNLAVAAHVGAGFSPSAVERSLGALAERHPMLRATFSTLDGEPHQSIEAHINADVEVVSSPEAPSAELLRAAAVRPFDLTQGPLWRVRVWKLPDGEGVLLFVIHHLIVDFSSLAVLLRDLSALYGREIGAGEFAAVLAPLTRTYAHHVAWQEELLASVSGERLWDYWRGRLAGKLPMLEIATDRPRPPVQTYRAGSRLAHLDGETATRLIALGSRSGATLFATLLAGFQALLQRYIGEDEVLIGSPMVGRNAPGMTGVVGHFTNTVVLRLASPPSGTVAELVARASEAALGALEHQDFPFALLAERLNPVRDPARPPLVQAVLVLHAARHDEERTLAALAQGEEGVPSRIGELALAPIALQETRSAFELALTVADQGDRGLVLALQFNLDLFDEVTAERLLGHLGNLLRGMVAAPAGTLADLPLLGDAERRQIEAWSVAPAQAPSEDCIHERFAAAARSHPERTAVVCAGVEMTYGELDRSSARLAAALRRRGVGAETMVALCTARSSRLVVALLGILRAGGAYVFLDLSYPAERLAFILSDSGASLLLVEEETAASLPVAVDVELLPLERLLEEEEEGDGAWSEGGEGAGLPTGENLAYLIYTSGSTGRPKGVAIRHTSVAALVVWASRHFSATELRGMVASTSLSFDMSAFELWAPLCLGGRVLLLESALSIPGLATATDKRALLLDVVPSVLREVLATDALPPGVETVALGGEPPPPSLVDELLERRQVRRVLNLYGPSEDTTFSTCAELGLTGGRNPPAGRPLDGKHAYLLDANLSLVPVGVRGEIFLAGIGLARGYHRRPELTAERFLPNPFSGRPGLDEPAGARMYRTGDLARRLPDGEIEFLGRLDLQVKVRGFRIELGEIESALVAHPAVREAVVLVRNDAVSGPELVAYVVKATPGVEPASSELSRHLRSRLPAFMVPSAFVHLEFLPHTPSGKVDRKALPAPERAAAPLAGAPPATPTEELVAGIWEQVLGRTQVRREDGFFDLGGHSLLATRVLSRIRDAFGVELPVASLFEDQTVAALAARIEGSRDTQLTRRPPLRRSDGAEPAPLSFAQEQLWFLDRLGPGSPAYNLPAAGRLSGRLDAGVLAGSLEEILRRHEVLRTVFREQSGQPVQSAAPPSEPVLPIIDLSGLAELEAERERLEREEARHPFCLARGPLARFRLLRLASDDHVLLVNLHHTVSDGWSIGIFVRELQALYRAASEGEPSPLPELPVRYVDWARWQRSWIQGEVLEHLLRPWRGLLADPPGPIDLPVDRPRSAVLVMPAAILPFSLGPELSDELGTLCRGAGATLFMTLLGALSTLLSRYGGQRDLLIGAPVAGRHRSEVEGLIGCFTNLLALRVDLTGDPPFRELLGRVRRLSLEAFAHQELPFEKLIAELRLGRDLDPASLVRVVLAFQAGPVPALELPGATLTVRELERGAAKFDLSVSLGPGLGGLAGTLEYRSDLFDEATARRLVSHLGALLGGIAADPDRRLSEIPFIPKEERLQVLAWNAPSSASEVRFCLHDLFELQAAKTPDAVAVVCEGVILTYGALSQRARRLASHLRALGVGPESRVGLCLERSPELVVAILGILGAGGAYVPLDPAHPAERLAYVLDDVSACLVVTDSGLLDRFSAVSVPRLCLDTELDAVANRSAEVLASGVVPENLAYVIYTSGSTGRPKGSLLSHANAVRLFTATAAWCDFGADDVWTLFHSCAFDFSVWEIWGALLFGGRLVVVPQWTARNPAAFHELLVRERVTVLNQTPSAFRPLIRADEEARAAGRELGSLRLIFFGGERLNPSALSAWIAHHGDERPRLVNMYGITETTVHVTWRPLRAADAGRPGSPIGKAIPDLRLALLDAALEPVPMGISGEIHVGGPGLARGYLGRPDLTAERFVPDPHGEPGARLYRSGDYARYRPDGDLEFIGRIDHQVKVRGFRVDLGEIEAVLASHPEVRGAVVLTHGEAEDEVRLVAWLVASPRPGLGADLRRFAAAKLPDYMLPARLVFLDRLPLTPNGKLDRRALPPPDDVPEAFGSLRAAPRSPVEEILAAIWCELLGITEVDIHHSFFELGGHSLLAVQATTRIREALGLEIALPIFFERPTVAQLAAEVERERAELVVRSEALGPDGGQVMPALVAGRYPRPAPLSYAQQRLWFLDQLHPGSSFYNINSAVRLRGPLAAAALAQALAALVERHEVLRTRFPMHDGQAVQEILPHVEVPIETVDLSNRVDAGRPEDGEEEARAYLESAANRSFDLATGPVMRVLLVRLAADNHLLLLCLHHIVADGWSMGVLVRELSVLYAAFRAGRPSPLSELAPLPIQYADYAAWQREWLAGGVLEAQLAYWRRELADAPPVLDLPTDHPRPEAESFRGAHFSFAVPADILPRLRVLASSHRTTLFTILLAAWETLLYRYTGQSDVVVGMPVANRNQIESEGLIGFFVNTLVLRTDLGGDPPFGELVGRVREKTIAAQAHQDVPFDKLVAELQPERGLSGAPFFRLLVESHHLPDQLHALAGIELDILPRLGGTSIFDLVLSLAEHGQRIAVDLEYNTDLFEAERIERMAAHYGNLLASISEFPDRRLTHLDLLTEAERRSLARWNETAVAFVPACLPVRFAEQARRTPEATALICGERRWSYRSLDAKANRLARLLARLGVGPERRVGICLDRQAELLPSVLAVLKAGGAYVPLDPAYPAERIAFLATDAGVDAILTERRLAGTIPAGAARLIFLDEAEAILAREREDDLGATATPDNLAYIMYTSGSSGRPKGVAVCHRNAAAFLDWALSCFRPDELRGVLASTSICFDISLVELFVPLACGGAVVLASSAFDLPALPASGEVTLINTVPSIASQLVASGSIPASVRVVALSGEALPGSLVEDLHRQPSIERVLNCYGPTETTVFSTWTEVARGIKGAPPIGRPIANEEVHLLGVGLQQAPLGVPAEICLGGEGVARGYLQRPDLTAERFRPDAWSGRAGARIYRTGDLGRLRGDGTLDYLGRLDQQIKLHGYRIEPGEIEAALVRHPALRQAVVLPQQHRAGGMRLVAFVVPATEQEPQSEELAAFLRDDLPAFMVPACFVFLEAMPLTPNGKLDRRRLPLPEVTSVAEPGEALPRTEKERLLTAIWQQVLGRDSIGIHDNLFRLGGDSILSLQIANRATQAGLPITPRHLFQHQTIAELAASVTPAAPAAAAQEEIVGAVPLTPIQHWFFEQELPARAHWNQAVVLELRRGWSAAVLTEGIRYLLIQHDAFRLRFYRDDMHDGVGWRQLSTPAADDSVPLSFVDLSALPAATRSGERERTMAALQGSLDLSRGPLLRGALFASDSAPEANPSLLMLVCHHLVVDTVSWGILVEDLATACTAVAAGEAVRLPAKTLAFSQWSEWLQEYAQSDEARAQLAYWLAPEVSAAPALPVDFESGANDETSARHVELSFTTEETDALRLDFLSTYRMDVEETVLAVLAAVLTRWTGAERLTLDVEGHGREKIGAAGPAGSPSRTVGCFITLFPLRLELHLAGELFDTVKAIKEQLRAIHRGGLGYGVLRYLAGDAIGSSFRSQPAADISFTYLSPVEDIAGNASPFTLAAGSGGPSRGPGSRRHLIEVVAQIVRGRLEVRWIYSAARHRAATLRALGESFAAALRELIEDRWTACQRTWTASDFPLSRLTQRELQQALSTLPGAGVEDIYALSPAQQGMLFHSRYSPHSGMYVVQLTCTLCGELDLDLSRRVWHSMMERFTTLRTSFFWEGLDHPVQIVHRDVALDWMVLDEGTLQADEREERFAAWLRADRSRGFELTRTPLSRLVVVATGAGEHRLIWTFHHLLLDGWSAALVLASVVEGYEALAAGAPATNVEPASYGSYIAWLSRRAGEGEEAFWRRRLVGFSSPTRLGLDRGTADGARQIEAFVTVDVRFELPLHSELVDLARTNYLTLYTVLQGAWALLLGHYSGNNDVVFGAVVSGRPPDLAGVDGIAGLFVNTLPVRARWTGTEPLRLWLSALQQGEAEMRQYESSALVDVQGWSDLPHSQPLFETIFSLDNYPVAGVLRGDRRHLQFKDVKVIEWNNYPLSVTVNTDEQFLIRVKSDPRRFEALAVDGAIRLYETLLEAMVARPQAALSDLLTVLREADHRHHLDAEAAYQQAVQRRFERIGSRPQTSTDSQSATAEGSGEVA